MTPSIWPAVLSAGVALAAFGVATSPLFSLAGLALLVCGVVGWVGEVRRGGDSEGAAHGHH